jgi:23S rRNA pseudouridine1911/1915/1917 synthase
VSEPTTRYLVGRREGGKRLDRFLHERMPKLSRSRVQRMIRERVTLSWGAKARPASTVLPGGEIHIGWTPLPEEPLDLHLSILRREAGWLAVDKPPGVPVHPVNRVRENSLIRILRRQEGREALRLAHRLDAETSGVLLVAEDSATARTLSAAFLAREVEKEYLALVSGVVRAESGRIDLPIGEDADSEIYLKLRAGTGKEARTDWCVERRYADRTLLRLRPHTGRRHQLRVHVAAMGHPILGDLLYGYPDEAYLALVRGEGDARVAAGDPARQLLHCARMRFPDPAGPGRVEVSAPTPADFEAGESPTP